MSMKRCNLSYSRKNKLSRGTASMSSHKGCLSSMPTGRPGPGCSLQELGGQKTEVNLGTGAQRRIEFVQRSCPCSVRRCAELQPGHECCLQVHGDSSFSSHQAVARVASCSTLRTHPGRFPVLSLTLTRHVYSPTRS